MSMKNMVKLDPSRHGINFPYLFFSNNFISPLNLHLQLIPITNRCQFFPPEKNDGSEHSSRETPTYPWSNFGPASRQMNE